MADYKAGDLSNLLSSIKGSQPVNSVESNLSEKSKQSKHASNGKGDVPGKLKGGKHAKNGKGNVPGKSKIGKKLFGAARRWKEKVEQVERSGRAEATEKSKSLNKKEKKLNKMLQKPQINLNPVASTELAGSENGIEIQKQARTKKSKKAKVASLDSEIDKHEVSQISTSVFCPPAGLVHESLIKKGNKRNLDDSDDELPSKKLKMKDGSEKPTRPRKDRLAKVKSDRTVFVGNLSLATKKKHLTKMFREFGSIESIRYRCMPVGDPTVPKKVIAIKKEFHPERHNCVGYVCFEDPESAKKALSLNGKEVNGLHIRVDMASRETKRDTNKTIFVGNLPFDIEEEAVRKHFEDCGEVDNVRLIRDKTSSMGKGFGYIKFKDHVAASFALKLNGSRLQGRDIRVMQCIKETKQTTKNADKLIKEKSTNTQFQGEKAIKDRKKKKFRKLNPNDAKNMFLRNKNVNGMDNTIGKKSVNENSSRSGTYGDRVYIKDDRKKVHLNTKIIFEEPNKVKETVISENAANFSKKSGFVKKDSMGKEKPGFVKKDLAGKEKKHIRFDK